MFNAFIVIAVFCLYMGILFLIAMWVERQSIKGFSLADNPVIYSLTLAVYCTSWTFYGSIGLAATSGMLFLTTYIGPLIVFIFGWRIFKRLIKIKAKQRITSIADLISARYDRSQAVAATAALIALFGISPYIALQLKAVISTFKIVADIKTPASSWIGENVGPIVSGLMIIFTNLFGVRRLDPTERHPGIVVAVALESLIKLMAFLLGGIFVTYFIYDGFWDIFERVSDENFYRLMDSGNSWDVSALTWISYIILSSSAIIFLPRQFHVTVVENFHENHIRTAMWLFPLYLVLINIFVLPVAMGGLLMGFPAKVADMFLLFIPFYYGEKWLALFVFIGGFSASTSMIIISSMTLATMISNHLMLPLIEWISCLSFLRRHLLKCRWAAVVFVISIGYLFEIIFGESYMLVSIGMISFAAVLQFAPAVLGGLFWKKGNKAGALAGMWTGFFTWFYTLLLPAFVKSGWLSDTLIKQGPYGIEFLNPVKLLGLTGMDPVAHSIFWSLLFNIASYVLCSFLFKQSKEEQRMAEVFVNILEKSIPEDHAVSGEARIDLAHKKKVIENVLNCYFSDKESASMMQRAMNRIGISHRSRISIIELAELYNKAEVILSGAIGAAAAHHSMEKGNIFTLEEAEELSIVYGKILAKLKITPEELIRKIKYYQERENLLSTHAEELKEKIKEKEKEILQRRHVEEKLRKSEEKYRNLFEFAPDGIMISSKAGAILSVNKACAKIFKFSAAEELMRVDVRNFYLNPEKDRNSMLKKLYEQGQLDGYRLNFKDRLGNVFPASLSLKLIRYENKLCIQTIVRDITELNKMEEELAHYTEDLERMVDEKTRALQSANIELSSAIKSLEDTQTQLAHSAHQAGMAELAVSVLHNIGNAVNSINVRVCGLENLSISHEIQSLEKIYNFLQSNEMLSNTDDGMNDKKKQLLAFFSATIDVIKEKDNMFEQDLEFIRKGLDHVIEIISVQQKYAGLRGFETWVNINDLIKDAEEMLSDSIVKRRIQTEFKTGELPNLYLDRNKMIQIFINIIKNAYESIDIGHPENEKKIYIETSVLQKNDGEYVNIMIKDTGAGISPEISTKVFRFNFSTKGRETGFGLHNSANYIRAQGGLIDIMSQGPGKGAEVIITLPVSGEHLK